MVSRYIRQVEAEHAGASNSSPRSLLIGKVAFHHARLGNLDRVEALAAELRKLNQSSGSGFGDAIYWINVAEGIALHYDARIPESRSKWLRGRAVAESLGLRDVSAIASAWLFFSHYLSEQMELAIENGINAIEATESGNYSAISRVSLTIALCLHYVDKIASAREWYTRCRLAAVNDGDEATLAALMHSMAWMNVSKARYSDLIEGMSANERDLVSISSQTVESYEALIEARSLPALTLLLRAQDCITKADYSVAIKLIDENFPNASDQGYERLGPGLLADRALCLVRLGEMDEAKAVAMRAHACPCDVLHSDDLVIFHSTLQKTFEILQLNSLAESHRERLSAALKRLVEFRMKMSLAVSALMDVALKNKAYSLP